MLKSIANAITNFLKENNEPYRKDFEASKKDVLPARSMARLESGIYADPEVEAEWKEFHEFEKVRERAW